MVLDGSLDAVEAPVTGVPTSDNVADGVVNEVPTSIVDHLEFYLPNYFKAGTYQQTEQTLGRSQELRTSGLHELPYGRLEDQPRPPRHRPSLARLPTRGP